MNYQYLQDSTYRINADGDRTQIANFVAEIVEETRLVDEATTTETTLTLTGTQYGGSKKAPPIELPPITLSADEFMSMTWPTRRWGTRCLVMPVPGAKDDLRAAIQLNSKPKVENIYKHLGWTRINKDPVYLHSGGGLGADGNDPSIQLQIPPEFKPYDLSVPVDPKKGFAASFGLMQLTDPDLVYPLLAATFVPLYGPVDFAVHLTGRTGTFKSELVSLFVAHYGPTIDARHLAGSWSSTANALEAQAYICKNAVFPVDDFVPGGTSWQQKAYQTNADKIIRAAGNQAGRARLSDTSSLQQTNYPRGLILSTGEDTPEGHSVRARTLILEISPGDIDTMNLSTAQANRALFSGATQAVIKSLATKPRSIVARAKQLRDSAVGTGHNRTPSMIGLLQACIEDVLNIAVAAKAITAQAAAASKTEAWNSIIKAGNNQSQYLEAADPVELFMTAIQSIFAQHIGHVRKLNGGVPMKPELLGWTADQNEAIPRYRSYGPCIGWIDWDTNEIAIDIAIAWPLVRKVVSNNELNISKQTLAKRLKEGGILTRTDSTRQRNTVRITAEDHPRQVLAMRIDKVLNTTEIPTGGSV